MEAATVRRTLERLAYASLVLDACIAGITVLTYFDVANAQTLLVPINYLLTVVVALSMAMFAVLVLLKSKQITQ